MRGLAYSLAAVAIIALTTTRALSQTPSWTSDGPFGAQVFALAINPITPTTLYVATNGGGVFRSLNGGSSWSAVNTGLTNLYVNALATNATTPTTLDQCESSRS